MGRLGDGRSKIRRPRLAKNRKPAPSEPEDSAANLRGDPRSSFVKRLGGPGISAPEHNIDCSNTGGVAIWNPHDNVGGSIPRFWLPEVLDQYEKLMQEVARRYEGAPDICEVVDSACMTVYAEPFYRAHADEGSNARLLFEAGINPLKKISRPIAGPSKIHNRLFKRTRTSLAVNQWDVIDESPSHHHDSFEPTYELRHVGSFPDGCETRPGRITGRGPRRVPRGKRRTRILSPSSTPSPARKAFRPSALRRIGGTAEGLEKTLQAALRMGANLRNRTSRGIRLHVRGEASGIRSKTRIH